uniref:AAA+ ATPase domain-containing protein n=1 Tax=Strombidium rassoulzadegani TaxID=1082188 RepID=A0A7S3CQ99_9SPIT|mmetsp:Transcript_3375/g.5663  ORF Transcript_3375/g.5663 Transcript_3375/m.5663 type:complete len:501 (+) Transcript_3375:1282-2784(+)
MNPMNIGKSKAKVMMEPDTGVKFDDVAGVDEAKMELTEIVDFLKQPERYAQIGAKIPRGALLIGPPGTGKTMLAKAVAGEAGVPFFSISAAEFIEMFVGVGASRVRDLFEQAKKNAPCIIFIDELDAVGRQRAQGIGMGNDEREQTINQLLTEMDGFEGNQGVIVLGATNIPDVLDKALLRPGRFDRQIQVGLPDTKGRFSILKVHAANKKLAPEVNLEDVAKRCIGMSGADLANVMNEAAIFTAREKKKMIEEVDIYNAIDRIQIGLEKQGGDFSEYRQKLVAFHEAGHALLGALMQEYDLVNKISIVPRGGTGGVTIFMPQEEMMESGMYTKDYLEDRICVAMGGRIAEEIVNGKDKVTTGASNDFQQCTNTAKMMVEQMGMSDVIGPRNISSDQMQAGTKGEDLKNLADQEVDRILNEQYERGMTMLRENEDLLEKIALTLIEKEKMNGVELIKIIQELKPDLVNKDALKKLEEFNKLAQKSLPTDDSDKPQLAPAV